MNLWVCYKLHFARGILASWEMLFLRMLWRAFYWLGIGPFPVIIITIIEALIISTPLLDPHDCEKLTWAKYERTRLPVHGKVGEHHRALGLDGQSHAVCYVPLLRDPGHQSQCLSWPPRTCKTSWSIDGTWIVYLALWWCGGSCRARCGKMYLASKSFPASSHSSSAAILIFQISQHLIIWMIEKSRS